MMPEVALKMSYKNWISYLKGSRNAVNEQWRQTRLIAYYALGNPKVKMENIWPLPDDPKPDMRKRKELVNRYLESEERKKNAKH